VFGLANWISPSVIAVIGPKFTMAIGGVLYLYAGHYITFFFLFGFEKSISSVLLYEFDRLFIAGFYLEANWSLYLTSVFVGLGAALIWTGNDQIGQLISLKYLNKEKG